MSDICPHCNHKVSVVCGTPAAWMKCPRMDNPKPRLETCLHCQQKVERACVTPGEWMKCQRLRLKESGNG
jgi:hypothetical protein